MEPPDGKRTKPMLSPQQQIEKLKLQGATFNECSEKQAIEYLTYTNNFLRLASYRKLYPRHLEGQRAGQYIGLDFEALRLLASADHTLRRALREITIDVEHYAHVSLLTRAMNEKEDGYEIVADYLAHLSRHDRKIVNGSLRCRGTTKRIRDPYTGELVAHYASGYPLWVFLEVIEFGRFCDLWLFCANRWNDRNMVDMHYI